MCEREGDAYGYPIASAVRPDARASTPRHKGDEIPGVGKEEEEQRVREAG